MLIFILKSTKFNDHALKFHNFNYACVDWFSAFGWVKVELILENFFWKFPNWPKGG